MRTFTWMLLPLAALALSACGGNADNGAMNPPQAGASAPVAGTEQSASFRQWVASTLQADPESEPADVDGKTWVDTAEDDPAAFDSLLTSVAE